MYSIKLLLGLVLLLCGLGVLSRPTDTEVESCDSKSSGLLGESQGAADVDDYNNSALQEEEEDGGAQAQDPAAECMDPKTNDADKKEVDSDKFQESELAGDSAVDERESRYQPSDYQACESEGADVAKYRDAFGGFPQDSGRGRRVKRRNFFYH